MKTTKTIIKTTRHTKRTLVLRNGKRVWKTKRKTSTRRFTVPKSEARETDGGMKVVRYTRRTVGRNERGNKVTKTYRSKQIFPKNEE
jgi:RNase P/RNase MRP subunit p29